MRNFVKIDESVAVVTGAGSGIGAALAVAFAAAGARVVAGDVDTSGAERTAQRITARGQTGIAVHADASTEAGIRAMVDLAEANFGSVDIYIANAGIGGPSGLGSSERDWDQVLELNLRAHVRAARVLMPGWIERGRGHFVSTASAAGLLTQIGGAAYAVTKHAAVGFAEWLAITYGDDGIGVSCLCPMGVNTPLLQTARQSLDATERLTFASIIQAAEIIEPDEVAHMAVDAVRTGRFLVLPHPLALEHYRAKGTDYEQWIASMRQYQRSLSATNRS
jgi:NAD(P)-dependent dehydrogenase (short-subunit alcohol dehydrogenase family)